MAYLEAHTSVLQGQLDFTPMGRLEARGAATGCVHIVDHGEDARKLSGWVNAAGLGARKYGIVDDFDDAELRDAPACLVIDADLASRTVGELSQVVARHSRRCSVVVTAHGADIAMVVKVLKTGAVDFVEKPFLEEDILQAIDGALSVDRARREAAGRDAEVRARYARLTPRERQVMSLVTTGKLNKQVAGDLGLSVITVKAHRGAAMRKMRARSLADLVRMADAVRDTA